MGPPTPGNLRWDFGGWAVCAHRKRRRGKKEKLKDLPKPGEFGLCTDVSGHLGRGGLFKLRVAGCWLGADDVAWVAGHTYPLSYSRGQDRRIARA